MAVSKAAQERLEVVNGLDLIWESRSLYAEILYCFRECHDICLSSGLFKPDTMLKIDQCGVDFRQLSLDTCTVAQRVSNQWLEVAIGFFESIEEIEDPEERKEMLVLLSKQARELAVCFKLIAAWARDLAARFHTAQDGTIKEVDEFKSRFEEAEKRGKQLRDKAQREYDKFKKDLESAEDSEFAWRISKISLSWMPISLIVTGPGHALASKQLASAEKVEKEAAETLRKAKAEMDKLTSENERAQFVAEKAATLLEVLGKLEETCDLIAAFWTMEADKFDSQAGKMGTTQAKQITLKAKVMREKVVKNNLEFWTKAKEDMDRYATAMSVINNSFNFETRARPSVGQSFTFKELEFTLRLPAHIDTKRIAASRQIKY